MSFKPFKLSHEGKNQWARFEPGSEPDSVFVRFQGACGRLMENTIPIGMMADVVADLYSKGYKESSES